MTAESSAAAALLWAGVRPDPDHDAVAAALASDQDAARHAAGAAIAQRVAPLLWRAVAPLVDASTSWARDLAADAARCATQARLVLPRLGALGLQPLADAGLEPLVWKGAALVERYPAPGLRPMDDVDVVVAPDRVDDAVRVLRDGGWTPLPVRGDDHHDIAFAHPDVPGLPLELHRELTTARERSHRLSAAELWRRRVPQSIAGADVYGLPAEDELVAIAAHAAKPFHVYARLLWSVDLAVVARDTTIDWDRVAAIAARARARTALAVGLTHARWLGAAVPPALCVPPATGWRRAALRPVLDREWPMVERDDGVRNRLRYALVDDRRLQVGLLVSSIDGWRTGLGTASRAWRRWRQLRLPRRDGASGQQRHDVVQPRR